MVTFKSKVQWFDDIFNTVVPSPLIPEYFYLPQEVSISGQLPLPCPSAPASCQCMNISTRAPPAHFILTSQARCSILCWLLSINTHPHHSTYEKLTPFVNG